MAINKPAARAAVMEAHDLVSLLRLGVDECSATPKPEQIRRSIGKRSPRGDGLTLAVQTGVPKAVQHAGATSGTASTM